MSPRTRVSVLGGSCRGPKIAQKAGSNNPNSPSNHDAAILRGSTWGLRTHQSPSDEPFAILSVSAPIQRPEQRVPGVCREGRDSPQVRNGRGALRLWQHVQDTFDEV